MKPVLRSIERAARELVALFAALALVPLAPGLGASYAGAPWQALVLSGAWAACWYAWLWGRLRTQNAP